MKQTFKFFTRVLFLLSLLLPLTAMSLQNPSDLRDSVYKIFNSQIAGTAFAVGPNQFFSNTHLIVELLKRFPEERIFLINENGDTLEYERLLWASKFDLALFTTKQTVSSYLEVKNVKLLPGDQLFVLGYPDEVFTKINKIEAMSITDLDYVYDFPVRFSSDYLVGASGSPVFNQRSELVGVVRGGGPSNFSNHISYLVAIKLKYLQQMLNVW